MAFADLIRAADRAVQAHLGGADVSFRSKLGEFSVKGMFDENYVLVDPEHAGVEQVTPAAWFRIEDLPVHPDDDPDLVLVIGEQAYSVRERQSDRVGGSIRLLLHVTEMPVELEDGPTSSLGVSIPTGELTIYRGAHAGGRDVRHYLERLGWYLVP